MWKWLLPAGFVCAIDQMIKILIRQTPLYETQWRLEGIVELTHYTNTGAAFSLMRGHSVIIAVLSVILLVTLLTFLFRNTHLTPESKWLLSLMAGGGSGNLLDRMIYGGVTDYIRLLFIPFPVFNFADICITLSVMALMACIITGRLDIRPEQDTYGSDH